MSEITALSPQSQAVLGGHDVIVFDGVCVLCSGFFKFVTRADKTGRFRFVTAQSALGQALYRELDLPTEAFETNLVIVDGSIYQRMDAISAAMPALGWPWRALSVASWLPGVIKDPMYHAIARNRYKIFGKTDTCLVPTAALRSRFLDTAA